MHLPALKISPQENTSLKLPAPFFTYFIYKKIIPAIDSAVNNAYLFLNKTKNSKL
jgi:hypothetical protein